MDELRSSCLSFSIPAAQRVYRSSIATAVGAAQVELRMSIDQSDGSPIVASTFSAGLPPVHVVMFQLA